MAQCTLCFAFFILVPDSQAVMNSFSYRNGLLHAEDVALDRVANEAGTPVYVYSKAAFERNYRLFDVALDGTNHVICYAMKANSNLSVLKLLANMGAGFDVVSIGEFLRARAAGIPGSRIVFSGVGKTREEMRDALLGGIRHFNAESEPELAALNEVALSIGTVAPVAIRINPDVDARTHRKISTGMAENKFGIPLSRALEVYRDTEGMSGIKVVGVDMHIGSQLTSLAPFENAFVIVADLVKQLRANGHQIDRLDLGGGLGVQYSQTGDPPPAPRDYCELIKRTVGHLGCEIEIEPGRSIAADAGILLASVVYIKHGESHEFLVLDAAMNDLLRPAMYDAHHEILPVSQPRSGARMRRMNVVGPVCETSDTFARNSMLPVLVPGELVAFSMAGAYGAVMSSEYNTRPLVPEVLVSGSDMAVVRPRPDLDEIIGRDIVPGWI